MGNVRNLVFCNFVVWKEIQWFWSINYNALFSRDIVSGEVKRWGNYIKYSEKSSGEAYNNVVLYKNKIIAIPGRERRIMVLDIENISFRYVNLDMPFIRENKIAFFAYVTLDKWLFMIGNEIPYIIKFDMELEDISEIINLSNYITDRKAYFRDAVLDKDKLLIPLMDENMVFEIDTDSLQWKKRKVGDTKDGFSAICRSKNSIWLMPRQQGAVLQWYRENDRVIIHEIEKEGFKFLPMKNNFHSGHFIGKRIWVFPFQGNMVFSFDAETGEFIKENAINRYIKTLQSEECVFRAVQVEQGHLFLLGCCIDEWVQMTYDPEMDKLEVFNLKYEISCEEYLDYLYKRGVSIVGENIFSLENFTNFLVSYDREEDRYGLAECGRGYQIWQKLN